jgi:thymidylate kinase
LEGADGSGKTTVAQIIKELCEKAHKSCLIIGRKGQDACEAVTAITELLQSHHEALDVVADLWIRVGREWQRAQLARKADTDIVLLDRFVLSVLSRVRAAEPQNLPEDVGPLLRRALELVAHLCTLTGTVLTQAPIDMCWERVQHTRKKELTPKEQRGREYLEKLAQYITDEFNRGGVLTGSQRWRIDTSGPPEEVRRQIEEQMLDQLFSL